MPEFADIVYPICGADAAVGELDATLFSIAQKLIQGETGIQAISGEMQTIASVAINTIRSELEIADFDDIIPDEIEPLIDNIVSIAILAESIKNNPSAIPAFFTALGVFEIDYKEELDKMGVNVNEILKNIHLIQTAPINTLCTLIDWPNIGKDVNTGVVSKTLKPLKQALSGATPDILEDWETDSPSSDIKTLIDEELASTKALMESNVKATKARLGNAFDSATAQVTQKLKFIPPIMDHPANFDDNTQARTYYEDIAIVDDFSRALDAAIPLKEPVDQVNELEMLQLKRSLNDIDETEIGDIISNMVAGQPGVEDIFDIDGFMGMIKDKLPVTITNPIERINLGLPSLTGLLNINDISETAPAAVAAIQQDILDEELSNFIKEQHEITMYTIFQSYNTKRISLSLSNLLDSTNLTGRLTTQEQKLWENDPILADTGTTELLEFDNLSYDSLSDFTIANESALRVALNNIKAAEAAALAKAAAEAAALANNPNA